MRLVLCIFLLLLGACKTKLPVADTPQAIAPSWVTQRPSSSMDYIGIGVAPVADPDHQISAKKNALNDLASEISVQVEGNSLLYTLENQGQIGGSFYSTIRTTTNEQLDGFEQVASWEDGTHFWTYYRLDKSVHARLKSERKSKAFDAAKDLYQRRKIAMTNGDLRSAVDLDLRALLAIKDHWAEADRVELDGVQVDLANALYADLRSIAAGVTITALPDRCSLSYANDFEREMRFRVKVKDAGATYDVIQVPVVISYPGLNGNVLEKKNTDQDGSVRTSVQGVDPAKPAPTITVSLDLDALIGPELDRKLIGPLVSGLTRPTTETPIDLVMPSIQVVADERNLGKSITNGGVAQMLREQLTAKGFRMVTNAADADMVMQVRSDTRAGGEANGFFTAYLDVTIIVSDRKTGVTIHEGGRQNLKGVQLDTEHAGREAYKKGVQELQKELILAFMTTLF